MELRDFQKHAINEGTAVLVNARKSYTQDRLMMSAPTGSGKSHIIIRIQQAFAAEGYTACVVSPRVEILQGIYTKMYPGSALKGIKLRAEMEECGLFTPVRLRNLLIKGEIAAFDGLIIDEAHHALADTYETLLAIHGAVGAVGVTATPFRGSPQQTKKLGEQWNQQDVLLTWSEACDNYYAAMPDIEIEPLLDDDIISMRSGEFQVGGAGGLEANTRSRLHAIAALALRLWKEEGHRPTMIALPTTKLVKEMVELLHDRGVSITQKTSSDDRDAAFKLCMDGDAILCQIAVVGEGIDMPFRVLVDAKPTMSPVAFQQLFGRITRPVAEGEAPPVYACTNRNLERHGYLLEGMLPRAAVKEITMAFPKASARAGANRIGLEQLSRFKRIPIPLADGIEATAFMLYKFDERIQKRRHYAVLLLPGTDKYLCAERTDTPKADGTVGYGKWIKCNIPNDFEAFGTSNKTWPVSDKQRAWWDRSSYKYGLDNKAGEKLTSRQFQVLPILKDLGITVNSLYREE